MQNDSDGRVPFDDLVAEVRAIAAPGAVTVVSYAGLKVARECGVDIMDFAEMYCCQQLIADVGTPAEKQRLKEELIAGRWATEINLAEQRGS